MVVIRCFLQQVAKNLGARWSQLSEEDKRPYEQRAERDKARYEREMAAYRSGNKRNRMAAPMAQQHEDEEEEEEDEEEEEFDDELGHENHGKLQEVFYPYHYFSNFFYLFMFVGTWHMHIYAN